MSPRLIATSIIKRVIEEKITLSVVLSDNTSFLQAGNDKALIQEFCYGTLRWYIQLEYLINLLLNKNIRKKDSSIKYLLLLGLYQLIHMRIPDHAVISETVETCKELDKEWAKSLVNAVLRRYQREAENLKCSLVSRPDIETAHPKWLLKQIKQDWPEYWRKILDANNKKPPMFLRVNQQKTKRDNYLEQLTKKGISGTKTPYSDQGLQLAEPIDVSLLPGFESGFVSVQELAAQFSAELLDLKPGQYVLDACAAPGSKSAHIMETEPDIKRLTVVEKDKNRAEKLLDTLTRLEFRPIIKVNDVIEADAWWDGQLFDRILLDTPCSATGVIRRHPDIKLLRTPDEVNKVNVLQHKILNSVWQLLKPGGLLLYVTCSILKQENADVIKQFIDNNDDCVLKAINTTWGIDTGYGKQIITGENDMDGFFYSCLKKQ